MLTSGVGGGQGAHLILPQWTPNPIDPAHVFRAPSASSCQQAAMQEAAWEVGESAQPRWSPALSILGATEAGPRRRRPALPCPREPGPEMAPLTYTQQIRPGHVPRAEPAAPESRGRSARTGAGQRPGANVRLREQSKKQGAGRSLGAGRGGRHPRSPRRWSTGTSPVTSRSKKEEKQPDSRDAGPPLWNRRACTTQRRFQKPASREAGYG